MDNYDFVLENLRFHLYKENTIIILGWYQDDNPDGRYLEVYLDDTKLTIVYDNKSGIPIRQKYLQYKANVNEEINASVELPLNWKGCKALRVYCIHGSERVLTKTFKTEWLKKRQKSIEYYVETDQYVDGQLILSGWAATDGEVAFELLGSAKTPIPIELKRNYRRDVKAVFDEMPEGYEAGFQISVKMGKNERGILRLTCGDKKSEYIRNGLGSAHVRKGQDVFSKGLNYLHKYGFVATVQKTKRKLFGEKKIDTYKEFRKKYEITEAEIEKQRTVEFAYSPKFSIVVPLYKTRPKYLQELIDSVIDQTYTNWELCLADGSGKNSPLSSQVQEYADKDKRIRYRLLEENKGISENTNAAIAMAEGEYIVLADHDDVVPANALYECAKALNEDNTIDIIYSDEDKIDMNGKKYFEPHFKSGFNIDLLCSMNYICHLFVVRRDILEQIAQTDKEDGHIIYERKEFDGAQDHDFILRCVEVARNIHHIPKILYHWRCHLNSTADNPESKMYAFEAGRKAVQAHYDRMGIPAEVSHGQFYGMYKTTFRWEEHPLISIIIPNKDHIDDLKVCMDSVEEKSTYRNFEFIIVENNSTEKETFAYYEQIQKRDNVTVLYYEGGFNFSRINNFGAKAAKGEYLLLLNNDTELINPDGLWEMLGYCMREDVGIVGAKLCYKDDTIQHAGVVIGFGGMAGHAFIESSRYDSGYMNRIICAQDYSAVTAACMMTKKSIFEQVGGLSEEYQVAFNDIDYCMKVRRVGKLVVYNPAVELYHYESKSRGFEDTPEKVERFNSEVARFVADWQQVLTEGDPYFNPNLSLDKADFSLKE